ncbi:MAG: insulinase family protein, partial [Candidatus Reddybacter sp.]
MPLINAVRLFFVVTLVLFGFLAEAGAASDQATWWQDGSADEGGDVAVLRSPNDERQYRYFQLDNKMKVLLVSDPKAEKSAASLNVYVGSFQNPVEREGLAHFLEHMLFLGTEKYPEAGEYQAYISEHGGQHNAYTSLEQTNYFFNVDSAYLFDTLDRFAQFFVAPRFDAEYVDRERHAVDSEYQLKIKDDSRREWDVLSELLNPKHPLAKFSVGNLETLVNDEQRPIRPDLLAFYQRYYSANLMTLVVLGNESLEELEATVKARFSTVLNHDMTVEVSGESLFARDLPLQVNIKPEKEKRELSLLFPMPSAKQYWRQGPLLFLGHLLGGESEGSFLAAMKARGLVESLSAGPAFDSREGAAFAITIGLTPQGIVERQQVLDLFYQWLSLA